MRANDDQNRIKKGARRGDLKWLTLVLAAGFVVAVPVLSLGFPVGHDSMSHFNWYKCFSEQMWAGEIYPRWLMEMNAGFGSPAFFYYPPVPTYVSTFLGLLIGKDATEAQLWQQLGFSAGIGIIASGVACYVWLKGIVDSKTAAFVSVIYLLMPYHISIDLYSRAALAEFWAFVWMPLVLKFVRDTEKNQVKGFVGLAVCYALLIMTHLPTTLIFSLIPPAYALFVGDREKRKSRVALTVAAMALGIGIAAVYLLPAMLMKQYVSFEAQQTKGFLYENWFSFSFRETGEPGNDKFNFRLSLLLATMIGGLILCAAAGKSFWRNNEWRFWWACAVVNVFMMTASSKFVWQLIPVIQSIQFPFRFNAPLCVAFAAIAAMSLSKTFSEENAFSRLLKAAEWRRTAIFGAAAILCLLWAGLLIYSPYKRFSAADIEHYNTDPTYVRGRRLKADVPEYMPKSVPPFEGDLIERLAAEKQSANAAHFLKTSGEADVKIYEWQARHIVLNVSAAAPATLTVGQFYFPGWTARAYRGTNAAELPVKPSNQGLAEMEIPSGNSRLELNLTAHWTERFGWFITVGSIIATAIAALFLNFSATIFKRNYEQGSAG